MKVKFIRHAQSEFNVGINKKDPNLTDFGKMQALILEGEYDLVIVSPLKRTKQTLECSRIKYKHLVEMNDCREYSDGAICNSREDEDFSESHDEFIRRVNRFKSDLRNIIEKEGYQSVAVISHACFMCVACNVNGVNNCQTIEIDI